MEIMWDIPFIPEPLVQTLTYIMSSRSTSLEPKSQLTINLDPGWECQSFPSEENKKKIPIKEWEKAKKERKSPIKEWEKAKKERKIPIKKWEKAKKKENSRSKRSEENKRNIWKGLWTRKISKQYRIVTTKQEKKGNHDLKWSSPFNHQPKSCALATFSPRTKQK